jgi:hypothetical protein
LGHGEGLGLLGNRTNVMSFIDDYNAPRKVKIDPLSDLLIDYVVVWHKYYVGSLNPLFLIVVGTHLPLFKYFPQLLYRERLHGSLLCNLFELILLIRDQFRSLLFKLIKLDTLCVLIIFAPLLLYLTF